MRDEIKQRDIVVVPEPEEGDKWTEPFVAEVLDVNRGYAVVKDQNSNCWEILVNRLEFIY